MKKIGSFLICGVLLASALTGCTSNQASAASGTYTFAETVKWDAEYDVVVVGFGLSGATAARNAAEAGADVLIVEKCPEETAGGNSKVAGQLFAYGNGDVEATKTYYKNLAADKEVPEAMADIMAEGIANMADILVEEFGFDKSEFMDWTGFPVIGVMSPEYPEFEGSDKIGLWTTHKGVSDSYFYQTAKKAVLGNSDKIDVWYNSPAYELIQDPMSKAIIGVKVTRNETETNIRALNGVVLCTGGFEDNTEMVQNYLGVANYAVIGGLYNTGDGIKMAQAVGADLWHMSVYEGGFGLGGTSFYVEEGEHASQIQVLSQGPLNTGSLILVGTDGNRFLNESDPVRHGHVYNNGVWTNPVYPEKMWVVYDEAQAQLIAENASIPEEFLSTVLTANSFDDLAAQTGMNADTLKATISNFNAYAAQGNDEQFGRAAEYMTAFTGSAYYAFPVKSEILNTQGGPRRTENAEILDTEGNPIPHLYSAGEMGGITAEMYQGGTNLAECVIFGQIAGKNAAAEKEALPAYTLDAKVESTPTKLGEVTDVAAAEFETADNQYLGTGAGMGGDVVVRVTVEDGKITNVEIMKQAETAGTADPALETIPQAIIDANSTDVDTVSGATITSKAIIEAVNDALSQVK